MIYVDYRDQKRTIKGSGYWYGRVAASNRLDVWAFWPNRKGVEVAHPWTLVLS